MNQRDHYNPKITTKKYWEKVRSDEPPPKCEFPLYEPISKNLPNESNLSFFEVGCAPGGILSEFCYKRKYEANGIDYAVAPESIATLLHERGVRVGNIYQHDFMNWTPTKCYDIVASFGFIEHFLNADEIADKHFAICKPGGHVIIEMPNFAYGQKIIHWLFDRNNLSLHNTKIMSLDFLARAGKRNDAELLDLAYTGGGFSFWRDESTKLNWFMTRLMWRTTSIVEKICCDYGKNLPNKWFSPYLFAVYKKRK